MKMIVAILRPEKLEAVRRALEQMNVWPTDVSQVLDMGPGPRHTQVYRGREVNVRPARLRLELAVDDWRVDGVVEAIVRARVSPESGQQEDDKVFVMPLEECASIGNGEPAAVTTGTWRGHPYRSHYDEPGQSMPEPPFRRTRPAFDNGTKHGMTLYGLDMTWRF